MKNNFCDFSDFNKKIFAGFIKEEYLVININNIDEINSIINKQLNSEIKWNINWVLLNTKEQINNKI